MIDDLFAREISRARRFGLRWRVLSDVGGFAVAAMIAAQRGFAFIGRIADQLQALGLASRSRVHGLARTLVHLGGVAVRRAPGDGRARLLAPCGWLPAFMDDWIEGHLTALAGRRPPDLVLGAARERLDALVLAHPGALFASGRLTWLTQALGGWLWLLATLSGGRADGGRRGLPAASFKGLAAASGLSRAHWAHLRAQAEARELVRRQQDRCGLEISTRFRRQARSAVMRRLALLSGALA